MLAVLPSSPCNTMLRDSTATSARMSTTWPLSSPGTVKASPRCVKASGVSSSRVAVPSGLLVTAVSVASLTSPALKPLGASTMRSPVQGGAGGAGWV
jgi:hypothetical protein